MARYYNERGQIMSILCPLPPSDAIALIESIGKELRQANSIRLSRGGMVNVIDAERPDLVKLKDETNKD